jgi:molybdopterin synthase sulfur carrier subunit
LANVSRKVKLQVDGPATIANVLDALEDRSSVLRGTICDQVTLQRRPFIRYFACGEDLSLEPTTNPLPEEVASGKEPLRVVGAMAGG